MSIFSKQMTAVEFDDITSLVDERASENIRLEFKRETPGREELLKKLSSFANTYGGYLVIGVGQDEQARASSLLGVPPSPGFHQQVLQWCYDGIYPPITPDVSRPILDPADPARAFYVINVPESEATPHFINGRRGCFVRTDEYSQRFEPRLATYEEIEHLANRRQQAVTLREGLVSRARSRFIVHVNQTYAQRPKVVGPIDLTMWMAIVPLFPQFNPLDVSILDKAVTTIRPAARQMSFPSGEPLAQLDGFFFPDPRVINFAYLEVDIHGMIFYSEELAHITQEALPKPEEAPQEVAPSPRDIFIYATWILAWHLFYLKYASSIYKMIGVTGPLLFRTGLDRIRGRQVRIPLESHGNEFEEGRPVLDEAMSLDRHIDASRLREDLLPFTKEAFRALSFACGWRNAYSAPEEFIDRQVEFALGYLMWHRRDLST